MSANGIRFETRACRAVLALLLCAGAIPAAKADDPDRVEDRGTLVEELQWKGPLGTAGTPAMQAQRDAFWQQVKARYQQYRGDKLAPDLLLEADRFFREADRQCAATPQQRVVTSRAALARTEEIHVLALIKLAAGQITRADMSQVEGQISLFDLGLKKDIEAARKTVNNP